MRKPTPGHINRGVKWIDTNIYYIKKDFKEEYSNDYERSDCRYAYKNP